MASPRAVSIRIGVPAADLEPVHVGQHQVEDQRVERIAAGARDAGAAGRRMGHAESGLAEIARDHLGEAKVVLDQQDARHQCPIPKFATPCGTL
jgi:hypothetical protein